MDQPRDQPSDDDLEKLEVTLTARCLASQAITAAQNWLEQVRLENEMQRVKTKAAEDRNKLKLEKEQQRMARELASLAIARAENSLMQAEVDKYLKQEHDKKVEEKTKRRRLTKTQDHAARVLASRAILQACESLERAEVQQEKQKSAERNVQQWEEEMTIEKQKEVEKLKTDVEIVATSPVNEKEKPKTKKEQAPWVEKELAHRAIVSAQLSLDRIELEAELKRLQEKTASAQLDAYGRSAKKLAHRAIVSAHGSVERAELEADLSETKDDVRKEDFLEEKLLETTSKHAELIIHNAFSFLEFTEKASTGKSVQEPAVGERGDEDYVVLTHEEAAEADSQYDYGKTDDMLYRKISNHVDGIINSAINCLVNTAEPSDTGSSDKESPQYIILTEDEKNEIEREYQRVQRELVSEENKTTSKTENEVVEDQEVLLKVRIYVLHIIAISEAIARPEPINDSTSSPERKDNITPHANSERRRSSVHFSEVPIVKPRRDSTYRPPTPRFLKWSKSDIDEQLWEIEDDLESEQCDSEAEDDSISVPHEVLSTQEYEESGPSNATDKPAINSPLQKVSREPGGTPQPNG